MKKLIRPLETRLAIAWLFAVSICAIANVGNAQDIDLQISSKTGYVGNPIVLRIVISDTSDYQINLPTQTDGLTIRSAGAPSRQSSITIFNGRRTESNTITQDYLVTPERAGELTIPAIELVVDGRRRTTEPIDISASESVNNGELLVEIVGDKDRVYVGEPLNVTLRIFIQVYENKEYGIRLDERSAWNLISKSSELGEFKDAFEKMRQNGRRPRGTPVRRQLESGEYATYFVFEIEKKVYPDRPGKIDGGDTRIIVNYPTSLKRSRGRMLFGDDELDDVFNRMFEDSPFQVPGRGGVKIDATRPIVEQANLGTTEVIPVPTTDRPSDYRGAVGKYSILTRAEPTKVNAGDPIKLWMMIQGDGPLDLVQPPPLKDLNQITSNFKVSEQPLAGYVEDDVKYFRTEIRPENANVETIPAIPFSFFDPETEKFETVFSDPIPVEVAETEKLNLDNIVKSQSPTSKNETISDQRNFRIATELGQAAIADSSELPVAWWISLCAPPTIWLCLLLFGFVRSTGTFTRKRLSLDRALRELDAIETPEQLAAFLTRYIGNTFTATPSNLMEGIGVLRVHRLFDAANGFEVLAADIAKANLIYSAEEMDRLRARAADLLRLTESETAEKGHRDGTKINTVAGSVGLVLLAFTATGELNAQDFPLTPTQKDRIFAEANAIYLDAESLSGAEAKDRFKTAAEKYELLINNGIVTHSLLFNQGMAAWRAGDFGRALHRLEQASLLNPNSTALRQAIIECQWERIENKEGLTGEEISKPLWGKISNLAFATVGPSLIAWLCSFFLGLFWLILVVRTLGLAKISYWFCVPLLIIGLVFGGLTWAGQQHRKNLEQTAIVLSDTLEMRGGDGNQYAILKKLEDTEGAYIRILERRGDWSKIETKNLSGWVKNEQVGMISELSR